MILILSDRERRFKLVLRTMQQTGWGLADVRGKIEMVTGKENSPYHLIHLSQMGFFAKVSSRWDPYTEVISRSPTALKALSSSSAS